MTETPRTTACPSCGAALRADAPWCTLCYADLRPPPPPPTPAVPPTTAPPTATYGVPASDPLTQPLHEFLPPVSASAAAEDPAPHMSTGAPHALSWPCTQCQSLNPFEAAVCAVCGAPFLAAGESKGISLVLPVVGNLAALTRGQRLLLAVGAVLVVIVPLAFVTLLLTRAPDSAKPVKIAPSNPGVSAPVVQDPASAPVTTPVVTAPPAATSPGVGGPLPTSAATPAATP